MTSLSKVRVSNTPVVNSIHIAGKYYSLASALDSADKTEIITELKKIQVKSFTDFTIRRSTLLNQFNGDSDDATRFMYILVSMVNSNPKFGFKLDRLGDETNILVLGDITHTINALEGTSAANGTTPIAIELGLPTDTTSPTIVSAVVTNALPNKVVVVFNEALLASNIPAVGSFILAGKTVTLVDVTASTLTLTVNASYVNGNVISLSYIPGAVKLKDLNNNLVNGFTVAVVNNVL
jgi:hypothetical protein